MTTSFRSVACISEERELADSLAKSLLNGEHVVPLEDQDARAQAAQLDWVLPIIDEPSSIPQTIHNEVKRLMTLRSYVYACAHAEGEVPQHRAFQRIATMAAKSVGACMGHVSIVDLGKVFCLASYGATIPAIPRNQVCPSHVVISKNDLVEIADVTEDFRFKDVEMIQQAGVKFYVGVPLTAANGMRIGAICIFDTKPRPEGLTERERQTCLDLGEMVMDIFEEIRASKASINPMSDLTTKAVASIAHNLLTPLTGIQLSLSMLQGESSEFSAQQRELVGTASMCSQVMGDICKSFKVDSLDEVVTQISKKRAAEEPKVVRLQSLIDRLKLRFERTSGECFVKISTEGDVPSDFMGDELEVFNAVASFLACAIHGAQDDNIWLTIAKVDEGESGSFLHFRSGAGKAEAPKSSSMRLPLAAAPDASVKKSMKDEMPSPKNELERRALVVDDSIVVRRTIARALTKMGVVVDCARDGFEGLNFMKENVYPCGVFLDFLMPLMDGYDCVRTYRQWEKVHRPGFRQFILGISAHTNDNDSKKGIQLGMDAFQAKPISIEQVKKHVSVAQLKYEKNPHVPESSILLSKLDQGLADSGFGEKDCLVITKDGSLITMRNTSSEIGWRLFISSRPDDTLDLLKARNWKAVLVDPTFTAVDVLSLVDTFRDWENGNRVRKQKNFFIVGEGIADGTRRQICNKVDGFASKPRNIEELERLLDSFDLSTAAMPSDLIVR